MNNYNVVGNLIDAAKLVSPSNVPLILKDFTRRLHANIDLEVMVKTTAKSYAYLKLTAGDCYKYSVGSVANGAKSGDTDNIYTITKDGNEIKYNYDTDGVDPAITSSSVPVGVMVTIEETGLNKANNGTFEVIESGNDYFIVKNPHGVAEASTTVTTGKIIFHTVLNFSELILEF